MITNSLSSNSIMDSKDGLIDDTNAQVADEKPIFILKKKWYITDLGMKLGCMFFGYLAFNLSNDIISDPNSSDLKIIAIYCVAYGMVVAFFSLISTRYYKINILL